MKASCTSIEHVHILKVCMGISDITCVIVWPPPLPPPLRERLPPTTAILSTTSRGPSSQRRPVAGRYWTDCEGL